MKPEEGKSFNYATNTITVPEVLEVLGGKFFKSVKLLDELRKKRGLFKFGL